MISRMSRNISSFFIAHGIIPENEKEVYSYSFEILFSTIINFLALLIISIISHTFLETMLYILGFVPLRQITGGYHAKNHVRCFLILMFSYTLFLIILLFMPKTHLFIFTITNIVVSTVLVLVFAPSEDKNKPLSEDEFTHFKKASRIAVVVYIACILMLVVFIANTAFAYSLAAGVLTVAISLMANYIKYKKSILKVR